MLKRFLSIVIFALLAACCGSVFWACSDDDSEIEFLFNREVSDLSVIRTCPSKADSANRCFQVRFQYPLDTADLSKIYLWIDSTAEDTAKAASDKDLENAPMVWEYEKTGSVYDTVDITSLVEPFTEDRARKRLVVAVYCEYTGGDPGTIQRAELHLRDDIEPSFAPIKQADSVWTTGALFRWTRPTDQMDFHAPNELYGPILGYNIVIYSEDKEESLRKLKVTVVSPAGTDSTGKTLYTRHARYSASDDSVWESSVALRDENKNLLRLMIKDGRSYNVDEPDSNEFTLIVEGLKSERVYKIGSMAYDTSGNFAGNDNGDVNHMSEFSTTDSIAPLMATKIFTLEDSLFPGRARLDSNNRLLIFWSRSVDPLVKNHGIKADSVLTLPRDCLFLHCYDSVSTYEIEYFDKIAKVWKYYPVADSAKSYDVYYQFDEGEMKVVADEIDSDGRSAFVTDTIRWVVPGDTMILRIRSKDKSGYLSAPLVDTIVVSPGELASQIDCPDGFVAVKASDSAGVFCMERYEHRNDSGEFMINVLHAQAVETCSSMSLDGFSVSLCKERDWELVCLSDGTLSYGVIVDTTDASGFLFSNCNVATNDSASAASITTRSPKCMNPMGVFDLPGQYQEWVIGRSEDTAAVVKGASYKPFGGISYETMALCTNRSFPYFTRPAYTTDTVYLYREGTRVDTVFEADTSRTPFKDKPFLTKKDFKDSLQFFDVQDSSGNSIGVDYALYSEYRRGGTKWLDTLGRGLKYVPDHIEVVFLTGEKTAYRQATAIYRSPAIGFRCCAYPE